MKQHTRSCLSRRTVLRGLGGLALSLPLLESQQPEAFAQTASVAKRFFVVFSHGGTLSATSKTGNKYDGLGKNNGVDAWAPLPGEPLQLGAIHQPLLAHKDSLLVLTGVNNRPGAEQSQYNGDHGWANVTALTAGKASLVGGDNKTSEGPSIDAVLAARLSEKTPVPFSAINLRIPAHNYGTPFFRAAREPVSGEPNPVLAFDKLFAGIGESDSGPDPAALRARVLKLSVLDGVEQGLSLFQKRVGTADAQAVDAHLTHIRSLEHRIQSLDSVASCTKPHLSGLDPKWTEYNVDIEKSGPAMIDVMIAAARCGLSHVQTLEIGDFYAKFLTHTFPASYDIGHSLHHSARDVGKTGPAGARWQEWYDTMLANRIWRMQLLSQLLDGLAETPEGQGTMLDHSVVLFTSEFSCGADHSVADVPLLIAGKAGGYLRTGRHINFNLKAQADPTTRDYETRTSTQNVYTTLMHACGEEENFGTEDHLWTPGPLSELT